MAQDTVRAIKPSQLLIPSKSSASKVIRAIAWWKVLRKVCKARRSFLVQAWCSGPRRRCNRECVATVEECTWTHTCTPHNDCEYTLKFCLFIFLLTLVLFLDNIRFIPANSWVGRSRRKGFCLPLVFWLETLGVSRADMTERFSL